MSLTFSVPYFPIVNRNLKTTPYKSNISFSSNSTLQLNPRLKSDRFQMHFSGNVDPSLKSLPPEPKEIIEMVRNSFEKPPKKIKNGKLTYEYVDKGGSGAIYKIGSGSTAYVLKVFRHPSLTESEIRNGSYLRDNKIYKDCAEYIDGDAQLGYLRMEYISRTKPIKIADREGITLKQGKVWLDDAKPANFIPVRDGKIRVDYGGTMIVGGEDQTPMNQEQGGRAVYW